MIVKLIVAKSDNNAIGYGNDLIWNLPADLRYFREVTHGHTLVMGRKTYESIGFPLPGRRTIVITRDETYKPSGVDVAHSIEEAMLMVGDVEIVFITGGTTIYKQVLEMDLVDELLITEVHHTFKADTFFPEIDYGNWKEVYRHNHKSDDVNIYDYSFVKYIRK